MERNQHKRHTWVGFKQDIMSIEIRSKDKKAYIVLGAPHSATSFISKILADSGVEMNSSDKLYHEDNDFVKVNRDIMWTVRGSVNRPPSEKDILSTDYNDEIKNIINKKRSEFWGWKDPRTSLTIKKYLQHLNDDDDVYLICCFRKPDKIVESKLRKEFKSLDKEKIDVYNKSIISAVKEFCDL